MSYFSALIMSLGGLSLGLLQGCSASTPASPARPAIPVIKGEYIFRRHDESFVPSEPLASGDRAAYPWEEKQPCKTKGKL